MDPRRVLTFRAVAHQRSFSNAARELSLSQPSVSNQVAALERELGTRLLKREPGGIRLTRDGQILLAHADAIAERFQLARTQLAASAHGHRARLRIGAFPTALAGLVPAAIAELRERYPDTKVTVDEGTDDLPARVRSGELHIALAFQDSTLPRQQPDDLERRELLSEDLMVALAPDHRLAQRAEVRLADLSDEDWTAATTDGLIVRACRAAGFEPNLVSITHDQLAIRALVTRGLAVTLAPQLLAEPFAGLALRPIAGSAPSRDVYALLPPGGRHPLLLPALEALDATAAQLTTQPASTPWPATAHDAPSVSD
ncbi:LysR family transcriptional regulator [Solirubrobacter ginsenosidimutans]|uniref:LysR family transcriptional regulator n=1 Tax=Solirubrobacter ginsenosidimutans TaxID=490573 RepID=A0A9X3MMX9_9ACTN|nr:LysR family transcriptional regulator [Solirubrobacter ginsenosidimutans]MDA0159561.1 LysR family transcriptional regulator [Solirubrobacter ginsenosidimutans]